MMEPLGALVSRCASEVGDGVLLEFEGATLTYAEFDQATTRMARQLQTIGMTKGDRVGLLFPNGFDYPVCWVAAAKLGAIVVPVNPRYQRDDLAYVLTDAGVAAVLTTSTAVSRLKEARAFARARWEICLIDGVEADVDLRDVPESTEAMPSVQIDDLLNLQYTSGTTGFPKGCKLTHGYWHNLGRRSVELTRATDADVIICAQPFYYVDPQWTLVMTLLARARMVLLPRFSASGFWKSATDAGATLFYCVGTMPNMLMAQPIGAWERAHKLRVIYCSGIDPVQHRAFEERWGVRWREAFGMTETGVDIGVDIDDATSVGSGTLGVVLPGKRATILDPVGAEMPNGTVGELCLAGDQMMQGYWNKPEATAAAIRDGWFHTGDLARRDDAGRYYLVGRIKDMIRRGGENIAASEVEQAIGGHPAVAGVAVTARPDPVRGEEVEAFVLAKPGVELDPVDLANFLARRIAAFKHPRYVTMVRDFPLTPSDRVEKHKLRVAGNPHVIRTFDLAERRWSQPL